MSKKTIKIKKYSDVIEELVANAAITPGHLVEVMSTGKVRVHASAGGNALPMFALEDELQGRGITTAFAADEPVQVWVPYRGDMVYAILKDGEDVAVGDFLESAGDGTLQKHTADAADSDDSINILGNQIVGTAVTAVDMSGSTGADPDGRIIVRIY